MPQAEEREGAPFLHFLTVRGSHLVKRENLPQAIAYKETSLSALTLLMILHTNPSASSLGAVSEMTVNVSSNYKRKLIL